MGCTPAAPWVKMKNLRDHRLTCLFFLVLAIQVLWDPILTCNYVAFFLQVEFGRSGFIMGISPLLITKSSMDGNTETIWNLGFSYGFLRAALDDPFPGRKHPQIQLEMLHGGLYIDVPAADHPFGNNRVANLRKHHQVPNYRQQWYRDILSQARSYLEVQFQF